MTEQQKAAFNMGYLQALTDLLQQTKTTPLLSREIVLRALDTHIARMKMGS